MGEQKCVQKGFTLIELMIVIGIIAILSAIALPIYSDFARSSANSACLAEAKGYTNTVMLVLIENETPDPPNVSSCSRITDASNFTDFSQNITAYPSSPGNIGIRCDLDFTTSCQFDPSVTN